MEPKTQFEKNLTSYTETEVRQYFELLEALLKEAGWSAGDQRFVFTPTKDGYLNFTIGQRHVLLLQRGSSSKPTVLKFISSEQLPNLYHLHTFSGEPEMYLYGTPDPKIIRQYWSQLMSACQLQYTRSQQSSFLEKSDPSFMRAAFEREYRDQLFATVDFATMFKIPFFTAEGLRFFQNRIETDQRYRKGSDQDIAAAERIKQDVYQKLNYWAELTVGRLGLVFDFIPDNHWNQSGYFKKFAWARVFFRDQGDRNVYFSLSVDSRTGNLIIKFDCSRMRDKLTETEVRQIDECIAAAGAQPIIIPVDKLGSYDWSSLVDLTRDYIEKHQTTLRNLYQIVLGEVGTVSLSQSLLDQNTSMETPLNQILYGPPGTGKTYATKAQAVAILDGALPDTRSAINQRYQELVHDKRITFVTFHQSSTYEDFVEGIKPVMSADEEEADVQYQIEDGIFKRMCVEATYEFVKRQNKEQAAGKTLDFSQRLDQLLNQFQQRLDDSEQIEVPLKSGQQIRVEEISKQGNFILRHVDGDRTYTVSQNRLEKLFNAIDDFNKIPNIYTYFRSIIGGSNASAYWAILNQLYQQEATTLAAPEQLSGVDYTIKQQAFYRMDWQQAIDQESVPKYLMIIDEINRGNVAAIFGELITLLEEDKRGGNNEYLSVTLPYSKERLVVPPNLYLIGTMNTADRSVEALDTALRRRFSFTEVVPQPQLLAEAGVDGLNLVEMLSTINHRIELLLDKDHCIGHAYFMGIATSADPWLALQKIFAQKVLPLLEEYFFGATGKIQLVLGQSFCSKQEEISGKSPFASDAEYGEGEYDTREIYHTVDVMGMHPEKFQEAVRASMI